jgi:hypothetical protein
MRRTVTGVAHNIADASGRYHHLERLRFYYQFQVRFVLDAQRFHRHQFPD